MASVRRLYWADLLWLLPVALAVRLALFNGVFGSDDNIYYERALQVAAGHFPSSNYNGALRYAFNLPAGLMVAVFGQTQAAVNLWPLACSLIELAMIYAFARALAGRQAAVMAALLLAAAPLQVSVASRIHADPVASAFLTSGVVLTYFGWQRRSVALLFGAGLTLGGVFWAKELAAVTYFGLLPLLWMFRGRWRDALWVVCGVLAMLVLHGLLMTAIAGDPLHLVRTVLGAVRRNFVQAGDGEDAAAYYLKYLFVDVRHTALLGWLAAGGVLALTLGRPVQLMGQSREGARGFLLGWLIGLLLVLSVFPVSLQPLRFTMKQSNYITLFLAPLAVAAAWALAALPRRAGQALCVIAVAMGLALAALQQADYRSFTANGKAAALWAEARPDALVLGSKSNANVGSLWLRAQRGGADIDPLHALAAWSAPGPALVARKAVATRLYVVYEPLTLAWPGSRPLVAAPLNCWVADERLVPVDLGLGNRFAQTLSEALGGVGVGPLSGAVAMLGRLGRPQPAQVYRVDGADPWCGTPPQAAARP